MEKVQADKAGGRKIMDKYICPVYKKCGGCDLQGMDYGMQLKQKHHRLKRLLEGITDEVHPVMGMDHPLHYRCKVNAAFDHDKKGNPVSGKYEKNSHKVVQADQCMIEDEKADEIIVTIRSMLRSFRIRTYDEDTGFGLLRHVMIRRGYATGEYMVILVTADPVFPSKNNFVKALRQRHPEITTVIQNINDKQTGMVLGSRNVTLYGRGFIEDELCGCRFRISPSAFYQVNPPQARKLYETAIRYANLSGKETVLDTYCGTGTIGIIASSGAGSVTGIELNRDAVRDAVSNARANNCSNVEFLTEDSTHYMERLAEAADAKEEGVKVPDVIILDPPRSGTTEAFINAAAHLGPGRIVYISCDPDTLARDLRLFKKQGYCAKEAQPVDLFPYTEALETVCLLSR